MESYRLDAMRSLDIPSIKAAGHDSIIVRRGTSGQKYGNENMAQVAVFGDHVSDPVSDKATAPRGAGTKFRVLPSSGMPDHVGKVYTLKGRSPWGHAIAKENGKLFRPEDVEHLNEAVSGKNAAAGDDTEDMPPARGGSRLSVRNLPVASDVYVAAHKHGATAVDVNTGEVIGKMATDPASPEGTWTPASIDVNADRRRKGVATRMLYAYGVSKFGRNRTLGWPAHTTDDGTALMQAHVDGDGVSEDVSASAQGTDPTPGIPTLRDTTSAPDAVNAEDALTRGPGMAALIAKRLAAKKVNDPAKNAATIEPTMGDNNAPSISPHQSGLQMPPDLK